MVCERGAKEGFCFFILFISFFIFIFISFDLICLLMNYDWSRLALIVVG